MFKGMDHLGEKTQDSFESPDGSCVTLYCHLCADTTQHLSLKDTALFVAVDRWTVHRWMKQGIVHGATLPCGVRVICESSLAEKQRTQMLVQLLNVLQVRASRPQWTSAGKIDDPRTPRYTCHVGPD